MPRDVFQLCLGERREDLFQFVQRCVKTVLVLERHPGLHSGWKLQALRTRN